MLQLWLSPRCCHRTSASKLRLCFLKKMREKSSLKTPLCLLQGLPLRSSLSTVRLSRLPQHGPVGPSLTFPPSATTTSPLDDPLSHSLTFSLRLIPLTMHVPKTDLIFIHGATPLPFAPPDSPALPPYQIQSLVPSSCPSPPSHLPIAPPRAPPMPPHHVLPCWNLEACVTGGVHQSRGLWWYKTLSMCALICSFCQSSTPELESATLQGEGGGPRVKTAANHQR